MVKDVEFFAMLWDFSIIFRKSLMLMFSVTHLVQTMCSTSKDVPYKRGCAVRIRHIISTSEGLQYESGISSVQARMCSTSKAHLQYKQRCVVRIRHIFSTSEDVKYACHRPLTIFLIILVRVMIHSLESIFERSPLYQNLMICLACTAPPRL